MKLETLDTLTKDELRAVNIRSAELIRQHEKEEKENAIRNARAILEAAGLSLRDVAAKVKAGRSSTGPAYRGGHRYQHPTKKDLVWTAKGQKPNWLRQLEKDGSRAIELPGDVSPRVA